jgi:hypothetical protein
VTVRVRIARAAGVRATRVGCYHWLTGLQDGLISYLLV